MSRPLTLGHGRPRPPLVGSHVAGHPRPARPGPVDGDPVGELAQVSTRPKKTSHRAKDAFPRLELLPFISDVRTILRPPAPLCPALRIHTLPAIVRQAPMFEVGLGPSARRWRVHGTPSLSRGWPGAYPPIHPTLPYTPASLPYAPADHMVSPPLVNGCPRALCSALPALARAQQHVHLRDHRRLGPGVVPASRLL